MLFRYVNGCKIKVGIMDILLNDLVKILLISFVSENKIVVIKKVIILIVYEWMWIGINIIEISVISVLIKIFLLILLIKKF